VPNGRRGTRISCKIPLTITGLDAAHLFSEPCTAILVNLQGCAARSGQPLEVGTEVRLEGLPAGSNVTARVVNCISPGKYEKFWLLGLALDEPGNVWGIETPPEDWHSEAMTVEGQEHLETRRVLKTTPTEGSSNSVRRPTENTVFNGSATLCHSKAFALSFPEATDLAFAKPAPSARPLILCLEDDESYLRLRKAVLEQNGYNVIGVSAEKDALSTLREAPVCMVLADHMLRGTTGTALAAKMKRIKPDVPVVLYSGKQPETLANVDVFINKDVSTQEFLSLVRDVMKRYSS
jgi:CheY-like chemotaxis protein